MKKLNSKGFVLAKSHIIGICVIAVLILIVTIAAICLVNRNPSNPTEPSTEPSGVVQPTESQPTEPQPTEPQPTEPPHTHRYIHSETNSYAATCEYDGLDYSECSCGAVDKRVIRALGHDFSKYMITETTHIKKCSRCDATQGSEEVHVISPETGRCICGYVAPEKDQAAYKLTAELNEKLGSKSYATMYDTLNALKGNGTIADLVKKINEAEKSAAVKILWDQTNGKFVAVKEVNGNAYILCADKGGLSGKVDEAYLLWDTYDNATNPLKIEKNSSIQYVVRSNYSIYWTDTVAPEGWVYNKNILVYGGFDMGEWETKGCAAGERISLCLMGVATSADKPIIVRTNCKLEDDLSFDGRNDKIKIAHEGNYIVHYGTIEQVDFDAEFDYYEYGESRVVRVRNRLGKWASGTFHTSKDKSDYIFGGYDVDLIDEITSNFKFEKLDET